MMGVIQVNPDVQAAGGFPVWAPGDYTLRVREVSEETSKSGRPMLVVQLEPTEQVVEYETETELTNPGSLFDRVMVEPVNTRNGQVSFLRPFVESLGLTWGDPIDTDTLRGKELRARVRVTQFEGNDRNEVGRYLKA